MIQIPKSPTADTRTCDFSQVTEETLLSSSRQHIYDVQEGIEFFCNKLKEVALTHDYDKISEIKWFHEDFKTGFKQTGWWDNHRKISRHHIDKPDGIPRDVNLIDVLEHITDCVMAGVARAGSVYPLQLPSDLLQKAFTNTVELLKNNVKLLIPNNHLENKMSKQIEVAKLIVEHPYWISNKEEAMELAEDICKLFEIGETKTNHLHVHCVEIKTIETEEDDNK